MLICQYYYLCDDSSIWTAEIRADTHEMAMHMARVLADDYWFGDGVHPLEIYESAVATLLHKLEPIKAVRVCDPCSVISVRKLDDAPPWIGRVGLMWTEEYRRAFAQQAE